MKAGMIIPAFITPVLSRSRAGRSRPALSLWYPAKRETSPAHRTTSISSKNSRQALQTGRILQQVAVRPVIDAIADGAEGEMKKATVIMLIWGIALWCSCASPATKASGEAPRYDVVVIGGGGGGLAAAARLAKTGKKVLLLEQHEKVGGYMTNFSRGDYTFEVSLHAFDGLDEKGFNRRIFQELGILGKVRPIKISPMYRTYLSDGPVEVPADPEAYKAVLIKKFPHEKKGIEDLFAAMKKISVVLPVALEYLRGNTGKALWDGMVNLGPLITFRKYQHSSLADFMHAFVKDDKLITLFTQLAGFLGSEPEKISGILFAVMWSSYHYGGYYYFEGGSQSVSNALADVIKENGGTILVSTRAVKIIIENGMATGVQAQDGEVYTCRAVISNANAPDTLTKLIGVEHLPEDYCATYLRHTVAASSIQVYLGVKKDYAASFPQGTHEMMFNASDSQKENYACIDRGDIEHMPFVIANYSLVDPACCPKGKNIITITGILPYEWENGWHEKESYQAYTALKKRVAQALIARAEQYLPGLAKHIEVMEVGSPRTMEHFTLNPGGSILGWSNSPDQSLFKRLPQATPIKNIYLAGAWTFPCGGQSAVLLSGLLAAEKILK
jgi:all-trans-retinol 13,14-reductase